MLSQLFGTFERRQARKKNKQRKARLFPQLTCELLEKRELLAAFTPGNLIILQAGDSGQYNTMGPLFLNEITAAGTSVQQVAINNSNTVGGTGNQPLAIDLTAAAGNGQLNRTYDGAGLVFGAVDSGLNNGGYILPQTPTGSANREIAVTGNDPGSGTFINTTTYGPFYVGDDNRGGVAESVTGPVYSFGHPNQAGGAVSQGVLYFPGPNGDGSLQPPGTAGIVAQTGVQVSNQTNIRGGFIGFNNVLYWTTAGATTLGLAGIYQSNTTALPTANASGSDTPVVKALFAASKVGGMFLADVNGNGILDNGDRIYLLDDGTVGGASTGGLYMSVYDTTRWGGGNTISGQGAGWSPMVRIAEGVIDAQPTPQNSAQLRGLAGTVLTDGTVQLYATEFDNVAGNNSYVLSFHDNSPGVLRIASASHASTTATITTTDTLPLSYTPAPITAATWASGTATITAANHFYVGETVTVNNCDVGGFNGTFTVLSASSTQFTYSLAADPGGSGTTGTANPWASVDNVGSGSGTFPTDGGFNGVWMVTSVTSNSFSYTDSNPLTDVPTASALAVTDLWLNSGATGGALDPQPVPSSSQIIQTFADGTLTASASKAQHALRGVSFAPLAATTVGATLVDGMASETVSPGAGVNVTVAVSNSEASVNGLNVTFVDLTTNTSLGQATITSGTATLTVHLNGQHIIRAYFAGGGTNAFAPATSSASATLNASGSTASTTALAFAIGGTSTTQAAVGRAVTLTATVTGAGATGTVSFYNNGTLIGSSAVSSTATLTTSFSTAGTANIEARYNGDATYQNSTTKATITAASWSSNTATITANNSFSASPTELVTVSGMTPSGYNGTYTIGTASATQFTYTLNSDPGGPGTVFGTATNALTIGNNATALITSSANNVSPGATPTYSANLTGSLGTVAGTVQFFLDGSALGSPQTLSGGATPPVTSTALTAGSHLVTISYTPAATSPYNAFNVDTITSANGVALIETAKQALTPGNLLAVQRGDGTTNLGSSGYLVFLDEYRPDGTLVQRIALPNADNGMTHALLLSGQNGSEGLLQESGNGQYDTIVGYDTTPGKAFVTSSQPYTYGRTIARIDATGNVDTTTSISTSQTTITAATWASTNGGTATITAPNTLQAGDPVVISGVTPTAYNGTYTVVSATSTSFTYALALGSDPGAGTVFGLATGPSVPYNPEDVVTNDGTSFWLASSTGTGDTRDSGILYAPLGNTTAKQIGPINHGAASIAIYGTGANAQVAVVNRGSGELGTPKGLANVGTGLPTSGLGTAVISTLSTDGSSNLTVTLNSAIAGLAAGNQVVISGSTVSAFNVALKLSTVTGGGLTLTFTAADDPGLPASTSGTGGTLTANQLLSGFTNLETEYENVFPTGRSPEQFVFLNTSDGSTNNPNLAYVADQAYGLLKFWKDVSNSWHLGQLGTNIFGQKLVFAGGVTGVVATIINPGTPTAKVNIYVTGSNVQQANPNQIAFFQDGNGAPAGMSNGVDQGFTSGNFSTLAFVGGTPGASPPSSPNGNMNFAGLAFVPGFGPGNIIVDRVGTGSGSLSGSATAGFLDQYDPSQANQTSTKGSVALPTTGTVASITAASWSGGVATITAFNTFTAGQQVTIAGVTPGLYNGTYTVGSLIGATTSSITGATWASGQATFTSSNTFVMGQTVTVTGVTPAGYNGSYTVVSATGSSFVVALATNPGAYSSGGSAVGSPTGFTFGLAMTAVATAKVSSTTVNVTDLADAATSTNITAASTASQAVNITAATRTASFATITAASWASNKITITAANNFVAGQNVTIAGITGSIVPGGYNGTFPIVTATSSSFTYTQTTNPGIATFNSTATITAASWASGTATITASNSFVPGQLVTISGMTPSGYNGTFTIVTAGSTQFTYGLATSLGAGTIFGTAVEASAIATGYVATITTSAAHNFLAGQSVTTAGITGSLIAGGYNGTFSTLAVNNGTTSSITAATWSAINGGTATFTAANSFVVGQTVTVSGMTPSGYNGTYTVLTASSTNFTVAEATSLGNGTAFGSAAGTAAFTYYVLAGDPGTATLSSATASGIFATITANTGVNTGLVGQSVIVANINGTSNTNYNGTVTVTAATSTTLTYAVLTDPGIADLTSGPTVTFNTATVTATNSFSTGNSVTVAGVTGATTFNGVFTILTATGSNFTYYIASNPIKGTKFGTATVLGAVTEGGTSTGEGYLTNSADGHSIFVAGYNQTTTNSTSANNADVAVVNPAGVVTPNTQIPSSVNGIRVAAGADALDPYAATGSGIYYSNGQVVCTGPIIHVSYDSVNKAVTFTYYGPFWIVIPGVRISVTGITPAGYNGTYTVLSATSNTFTATLLTNPGPVTSLANAVAQQLPALVTNEISAAQGQAPTVVGIGNNNTVGSGTGTPGQLYGTAGAQFQNNGVPSVDGPFFIGSGLNQSAGQAVSILGTGADPNWPNGRDIFGNFPSTNQIAISPDGEFIFVADSRADSKGGLLVYYQNGFDNWLRVANLQLDNFAITGASEPVNTANVTAISYNSFNITAASWINGTVTITTSSAHGFTVGQKVNINGFTNAGYNGQFTIASVPSSTTFTYAVSTNPGTPSFSSPTAMLANVTVTANNSFVVGQNVTIAGVTPNTPGAYDGTFAITAATSTTFTYIMTVTTNPGSPTLSSATATVNSSATITTSTPVNFTVGQTVNISGVDLPAYNNSFGVTVTSVAGNGLSFTYNPGFSNLASSGPGVFGAFANGQDGGFRGITADFSNYVSGSNSPVDLYLTTTATSGNRLFKVHLTNVNSSAGTATIGTQTVLATAAANTAFRGVAFAPTNPGTTASTTTLAVSGDPGVYGVGDTLTATVTSGATGWVSFRTAAGVEIGAAPLIGNTATFATGANLGAGGPYSIVAVYTGDGTYSASTSAAHSVTITKHDTSTALTFSPTTVGTGQNEILTATISVPAGLMGNVPGVSPTGTVTFTDLTTSTTLGTAAVTQVIVNVGGNPVVEFQATLTTTFSTTGAHSIKAAYSGDANFNASSDTETLQVVTSTTTTVTSDNANPLAKNQLIHLSAAVAASSGTPAGTVQFYDGTLAIGAPVTLNGSGVATLTVNTSPVLSVTIKGASQVTSSGLTTVTITTDTTSPFQVGQVVTVEGIATGGSPANAVLGGYSGGYDGTFTIASVIGATFTYLDQAAVGLATDTVGGMAVGGGVSLATALSITNATWASNQATFTANNSYNAGDTVTVANVNPSGYNGTYIVQSATSTTFTVNLASNPGTFTSSPSASATLIGAPIGSSDLLGSGLLTAGLNSITAIYNPGANAFGGSTGVHEQAVQAQPFGVNDVLVEQLGDGITPLNTRAPNPVNGSIGATNFVDDFTPAGVLVQEVILPTADSPSFGLQSATGDGTTVTVNTSSANDFVTGQKVTITGVTGGTGTFNGDFVITVVNNSTFTYLASGNGSGTVTAATTAQGVVHAVVGDGQQSTTGQMTLSGDGQFLFLTGYDNNPLPFGTALPVPSAANSEQVPRSIARIKYDGTIDTEAFTVGASGVSATRGNFNAVYSPDGSQFYVGGNSSTNPTLSSGIYYFSSFTTSATLQGSNNLISAGGNLLVNPGYAVIGLESYGGNLYVIGGGSNVGANFDLAQVGTGFPTTNTGLTVTQLPGIPVNTTSLAQPIFFPVDAYFTHLNGAGSALDTIYVADNGKSFGQGSITKWSLVSSSWVESTVSLPYSNTIQQLGFYYLNGITSGTNVTLYTTYGNGGNADFGPGFLYSMTDAAGYNTAPGIPITAASWASSTVTITANNNYVAGQYVTITGISNTAYNGRFVITFANATSFQYAIVSDPGASGSVSGAQALSINTTAQVAPGPVGGPWYGNKTFRGVAAAPEALVQSVLLNGTTDAYPVGLATISGTTVTLTSPSTTDFGSGQRVTVSGVNGVLNGGYNGTFTVTGASGTSFTYADTNFNITSATEATNTVTIATSGSAGNGFVTGQIVTIAGVAVAGYNGSFPITVVDATHFTYTDPNSGLGSSSGGTATANETGGSASNEGSTIASASQSGHTVTVTTNGTTNGLAIGQHINITGANAGYNGGGWPIANVVDATHFTYVDTNFNISSITESGNTVTVVTGNNANGNGFANSSSVAIAGVGVVAYNGTFTISTVNAFTFTYTDSTSGLTPSITNATEATNTVTITTAAVNGFAEGDSVTISGVGVAGYNGTFTIHVLNNMQFQYTDSTSGLVDSSGGTATGSTTGASAAGGSVSTGTATLSLDPQQSMVNSVTYKFNKATAAPGFAVAVHGLVNVQSASSSSTTATIVTTQPNGFVQGQLVQILGVNVAGYNTVGVSVGNWAQITQINNPSSFNYTTSGSNLAAGTGGTVSFGGSVPTVNASSPDGGKTWIVTFSGTGVLGNSIGDGVYDLTYTNAVGKVKTDTFYRLYGDSQGLQVENGAEFSALKAGFGHVTGDVLYNFAFDLTGAGSIAASSLTKGKLDFSKALFNFTPTIG
jgi:hypothetical protein